MNLFTDYLKEITPDEIMNAIANVSANINADANDGTYSHRVENLIKQYPILQEAFKQIALCETMEQRSDISNMYIMLLVIIEIAESKDFATVASN